MGKDSRGQGVEDSSPVTGILEASNPGPLRLLRHYANAVWAENIKEWKLELTYPIDFLRGLIDPVVYLLPYVFYGIALVGGRSSANLQKLVGTSDIVSFITIGYVFVGFMNMALWAMGFSLRKEQMYGTLESVFAAPVPRWIFTMGMSMLVSREVRSSLTAMRSELRSCSSSLTVTSSSFVDCNSSLAVWSSSLTL